MTVIVRQTDKDGQITKTLQELKIKGTLEDALQMMRAVYRRFKKRNKFIDILIKK